MQYRLLALHPHWGLFRQLLRREIGLRYRGSVLGLTWSFVLPLVMLAIYTYVFGVLFQLRWQPQAQESTLDFALTLFAGLIVFNFFAEVFTRAPGLVIAQPNYVKKVVFPLTLIPLVATVAALFHAAMGLGILVLALTLTGRWSWWVLALPLAWLPLCAFVAGLAWFLAALGVYVRDTAQVVGPAVSALLFLSPVFYPASALPEVVQQWLWLNPLSVPIEATRSLTLGAQAPDWGALCVYGVCALGIGWLGWWWFEKTRSGFADVL